MLIFSNEGLYQEGLSEDLVSVIHGQASRVPVALAFVLH